MRCPGATPLRLVGSLSSWPDRGASVVQGLRQWCHTAPTVTINGGAVSSEQGTEVIRISLVGLSTRATSASGRLPRPRLRPASCSSWNRPSSAFSRHRSELLAPEPHRVRRPWPPDAAAGRPRRQALACCSRPDSPKGSLVTYAEGLRGL